MTQVFEIFNAVDGKTHGYRFSEARARQTVDHFGEYTVAGFVADYLPAKDGFFVLDMRDSVKAGPFAAQAEAEKERDWENMCNDANAFRVFEQRI